MPPSSRAPSSGSNRKSAATSPSPGGRGRNQSIALSEDRGLAASGLPPLLPTSPAALGVADNLFSPQYGTSLVESVLAAIRDAADCIALEDFAAQKIQATFRMWVQRKQYSKTRSSIITMQRVYRGHLGRRARDDRAAESERSYQVTVFNHYATRIQAMYRGYRSRKYVDNFYARKEFIWNATRTAETVRSLANTFHTEQTLQSEKEQREAEESQYRRATTKAHPLLSTASVSGVYRRPLYLTGTATVFEGNVEEDIRVNTMIARRPDVEAQSRFNATHSLKAQMAATAPAGLKPISGPLGTTRTKQRQQKQQSEAVEEGEAPGPLAATSSIPTLPDIRHNNRAMGVSSGRRPKPQPQPHYYLPCESAKPSCSWELDETRPSARPLIEEPDRASSTIKARQPCLTRPSLDSQTASTRCALNYTNAEVRKTAVSSQDPRYVVQEHDCELADGGAGSVYNTKMAALQRSVDTRVQQGLHGHAAFKVPAARGVR